MLLNADDGRILYSLNPDERLPMGSTTKMMTALIVVEDHVESQDDLQAPVTASRRAAALRAALGYSSINLQAGESLTLEQMLNGLLIPSGDDAAVALAEYDAGSVEAFAAKMNQQAQRWASPTPTTPTRTAWMPRGTTPRPGTTPRWAPRS